MPPKNDTQPENQAETTGSDDEMNSPITILIADDHVLVREGTRRLLGAEPDRSVIA